MSSKHVANVWKKSPAHVRGADLLLLLVIAENTMEDSGLADLYSEIAAREIHEDIPRVYESLDYLWEHGIIEPAIVRPESPYTPWGYPVATLRLCDVSEWANS